MKVDLKKIALDSIDLNKLGGAIIDEVLEKALDEIVLKTKTTLDDSAKTLLYPILEAEMKKKLAEFVAKLQAE